MQRLEYGIGGRDASQKIGGISPLDVQWWRCSWEGSIIAMSGNQIMSCAAMSVGGLLGRRATNPPVC